MDFYFGVFILVVAIPKVLVKAAEFSNCLYKSAEPLWSHVMIDIRYMNV